MITELNNIVDDPSQTSADLSSSLKSGIIALQKDCDLIEGSSMLYVEENKATSAVKDVGDYEEVSEIMAEHVKRRVQFEKQKVLSDTYIKTREDMPETMKYLFPLDTAYVKAQEAESTSQHIPTSSSWYSITSLERAKTEMLLYKKKYENFNEVNKGILDIHKKITVEKQELKKYMEKLDASKKEISDAIEKVLGMDLLSSHYIPDLHEEFRSTINDLTGGRTGKFSMETVSVKGMEELTVGERRLMALTYIISVQKLDPAPFYLLDDIENTLDSQYQKAFKDMTAAWPSQILHFTSIDQSTVEDGSRVFRLLKENDYSRVEQVR